MLFAKGTVFLWNEERRVLCPNKEDKQQLLNYGNVKKEISVKFVVSVIHYILWKSEKEVVEAGNDASKDEKKMVSS